jgi:hypothetical protein
MKSLPKVEPISGLCTNSPHHESSGGEGRLISVGAGRALHTIKLSLSVVVLICVSGYLALANKADIK